MSLLQDEDRRLIQDSVDKFIAEHYVFEGKAARLESFGKFGGNWKLFADLGWLALPFSEACGGMGGGLIDVQVLMRAFGRGLIAEPFAEVILLAGKVIEHCTDPETAVTMLTPLLAGESKIILAHGEYMCDPGFDWVKAQAVKNDQGYCLNGVKRVVSQASVADQFLVTALLNNEPALFLVDANAEGLVCSEYSTIDSRYAADICLENCQLNDEALLACGSIVSNGVKDAALFMLGATFAEIEGIAVKLRQTSSEYLNIREQFGSPLRKFQALQHMLADMVIAEEEIKSLTWMIANSADIEDGSEREKQIRTSKARIGQVGRTLAEIAVQLHGGVGVTDELIVGHYLRRMIAFDATFGDTQHQLLWLSGKQKSAASRGRQL